MKKWIDKFILCEKCGKRGKWAEPKKIIYTENVKNGFGGFCDYGLFSVKIEMRPKYVNDEGLKKHELTHARQFGRLLWVHTLLGMVSGKYRLFIELQAYREQIKCYGYTKKADYMWVVNTLYNKYNTGVDLMTIQEYADYCFADLILEIK